MPSKSVALIISFMTPHEDMRQLAASLLRHGISLSVIVPKKFDRASLHAAVESAKSLNAALVISLLPLGRNARTPGNMLCAAPDLDKLTQFERFSERGIATLATKKFEFGMSFPGAPESRLTLKPSILDTSSPRSMITLHNGMLPTLTPAYFESDHPIHKHSYVVQEFMDTKVKPTSYRVVLFCGVPFLAYEVVSRHDCPALRSDEILVGPQFISNSERNGYDVRLTSNAEMLRVAVEMSAAVGHPPLAKCDLLYNEERGWVALEISANDFNGWPLGRRNLVNALTREAIVDQFSMFDSIARRMNELVSPEAKPAS